MGVFSFLVLSGILAGLGCSSYERGLRLRASSLIKEKKL
ncbi:hypothetical protein D1AOALGA4SA_8406 [Olavius algarvensis Delta 1 endosymbiont]|nr:hypothetical protein D1AOALGA4SA_8406 [Olavius algarvensis Delta 1 endosymbiont]